MSNLAPEIRTKTAYEERVFEFDWVNRLTGAETLSGTPTVTVLPTGLVIGATAIAGTKVQFALSSGTANTEYLLTCRADTSTGQKFEGGGKLLVIEVA